MFWQGASYLTKVTPKTGSVLPDEGYSKNRERLTWRRLLQKQGASYLTKVTPKTHTQLDIYVIIVFQIEALE